MEVILFILLSVIMMFLCVIGREFKAIGFVGGLGLCMMAFFVMTSGLQVQTGAVVTATGFSDVLSTTYTDIATTFAGINIINTLLAIVFGGAGILFTIYSVN